MSDKLKHLVKPAWLRIPLKVLCWTLLVVIMIPVLLYIPPVQTAVKDLACRIVKDKTGMDISIGRFRLKFPLDVSLEDVSVVEATGDTMVNAKGVVADVRLLPLLSLDVKVNKLELTDGYYRFVSPDSSMIMKIRAHRLQVDSRTSVNISKSEINLNRADLEGGDISLYMDVWKQKPTPPDTTATPFLIKANELNAKDVKFAMSMLPTIDTLTVAANDLSLREGVIDLRTNNITARLLTLDGGDFAYISPTPEYIKTHPAPELPPTDSAPMTIKADSISVSDLKALYALKGATPLPGFDANYIQFSDVNVGLHDFYNQTANINLPISHLSARERCGLQVVDGHGVFSMTEEGMNLDGLEVMTPFSKIGATASIPFALMELKPEAPIKAKATATIGIPDICAFMPMLSETFKVFPDGRPLTAKVEADGRLDDVTVRALDAAMPGVFSVRAEGRARNVLDINKLIADIDIDGEVADPRPIDRLAGDLGFEIPPLKLTGKATANRGEYTADMDLRTPKGSLLADARAGLNSERYFADVDFDRINVAHFVPDLGIGIVSGNVKARGLGFNPLKGHAGTDVSLCIDEIDYNGYPMRDISLQAVLIDGQYHVDIDSPNEYLNIEGYLHGMIEEDDYTVDGTIKLYNADLYKLGLMEEETTVRVFADIDGRLRPERWLYDAHLELSDIEYNSGESSLSLPSVITAELHAGDEAVTADIEGELTTVSFRSQNGLQKLVEGFTAASEAIMKQVDARYLDVADIQHILPPFTLSADASGHGLLSNVLEPSGLAMDTIKFRLANDTTLHGGAYVTNFTSGTLTLDTINLGLHQRGSILDYIGHVGNRPGTLDEFAQVDLGGFIGTNRVNVYLRQKNIQGLTGYKLGMTLAAEPDSVFSLSFSPTRAIIAYMPWTFNDDNNITLDMANKHITANLDASSNKSGILLRTEQGEKGEELHLNLRNINIEDFLNMSITAPPLQACINSDLRVRYTGKALVGSGNVDIDRLVYDKMMIGDIGFDLKAGSSFKGRTGARVGMRVDGKEAMVLSAVLKTDEGGFDTEKVKLSLTEFPLSIANPFLGADVMKLSGALNGDMQLTGSLTRPLLNGSLACDSVSVFVPMMGSSLKISDNPITVTDNILSFNRFSVYGQNQNPLTLNGSVNAQKFSDIQFDLTANAQNFQLINNDRRAKSDLYGKLNFNLGATVKGPMKHFDINANLGILNTTDVYYNVPMSATSTLQNVSSDDVVKFVNFNDTTQVAKADSVATQMAMRINATLSITPGTHVTANLGDNGTYKVSLTPSGNLSYYQNFMGDMTLNGQLFLGEGLARYGLPVIGDKTFHFKPDSYVMFNGNIMNPSFNISATDEIKASVVNSGGNSQRVNFLVTLDVTGNLNAPKINFDLSTDDDLALQNELTSMSPDQRSTQAMNLLITGMYSGNDMKTDNSNMLTGGLYSFLTSQINSWAAKNIRGVDLSFGVDQFDKTTDGQTSTAMSYSYQVSKSLFSNKFKIVVGGNYTTDASADESFAENLFSDVSFEYTLKQTNSLTMLVRLYRHIGYESILEGEITETGVGFVMRRKLDNLRKLFKVRWGKRKPRVSADSVATKPDSIRVESREEPSAGKEEEK